MPCIKTSPIDYLLKVDSKNVPTNGLIDGSRMDKKGCLLPRDLNPLQQIYYKNA